MTQELSLLGSRVRDRITGFTGVATGRAEYLDRGVRYLISPPLDKDGKYVEPLWFPANQLDVLVAE